MRTRPRLTLAVLLLTLTLTGCATKPGPAPAVPGSKSLVVFLVRHAEKVDDGEDPQLSPAGRQRAALLADTLEEAGVEHIHSSDLARTRETAAPTAARFGVEVELYDPRDLPALARRLRDQGGRHLVVGHSNTTPAMVELLGGEPGSAIDEQREYDRLYFITIERSGAVSSVLLNYGAPYDPGHD